MKNIETVNMKNVTVTMTDYEKRKVQQSILEKGIDSMMDGYQIIFELGLKEFKNMKEVKR